MTFLPIIARELQTAARKRSTFWVRIAAALLGMCAALICVAFARTLGIPKLGSAIFSTLTWMSLAGACLAGLFFTSDCISEEKREGTLGFLFLTDLRGYDVVGGKLLATSLRTVYVLLALLPILAVCILMGGVNGAQFWKTTLALLNMLFLSLATGMAVSATVRDSQRALGGTMLLLIILCAAGPAIDLALTEGRGRAFQPRFSLSSPVYTFVTANAWGRTRYWTGLVSNVAVGCILLALASFIVPRTWQERKRNIRGVSPRLYAWRYGSAKFREKLRRKLLDRNPVIWLLRRERRQTLGIWSITLALAAAAVASAAGGVASEFWFVWAFAGSLLTFVLYVWVASKSTRFFVEARRSGLLELLLSAPLTERHIVLGASRGLLREFSAPLFVLVLLAAARTLFTGNVFGMAGARMYGEPLALVATAVASAVSMVTSLLALEWFGMWMGLTSRSANIGTLKTILFVQISPAVVIYVMGNMLTLAFVIPRFAGAKGMPQFSAWLPLLLLAVHDTATICKNLFFYYLARQKLLSGFRAYAAGMTRAAAAPPPVPRGIAPPTPALGLS